MCTYTCARYLTAPAQKELQLGPASQIKQPATNFAATPPGPNPCPPRTHSRSRGGPTPTGRRWRSTRNLKGTLTETIGNLHPHLGGGRAKACMHVTSAPPSSKKQRGSNEVAQAAATGWGARLAAALHACRRTRAPWAASARSRRGPAAETRASRPPCRRTRPGKALPLGAAGRQRRPAPAASTRAGGREEGGVKPP